MRTEKSSGFILVAVLLIIVTIGILSLTLSMVSVTSLRSTTDETRRLQAFYSANTGLERTYARIKSMSNAGTVTSIDQLASSLGTTTGSVPGGSFTVTPSVVSRTTRGGELALRSTGKDTAASAERVVETTVSVELGTPGNVGVYAPAAFTTTGDTVNSGNAPIAGSSDPDPNSNLDYGFTCSPASTGNQCVGSGSPATYSVTLTSGTVCNPKTLVGAGSENCLNIGEYITHPSNTGARYVVTGIEGNDVTLKAISELRATTREECRRERGVMTCSPVITGYEPAPLSHDGSNTLTLRREDSVASIMYYNSSASPTLNGTQASGTCTTYACTTFSFPPSSLFEMTFGTDKSTFYAGLPAASKSTADACNTVTWAAVTDTTVHMSNCTTTDASGNTTPMPRVLIIDTRAATGDQVQVKLNSGTFHGLLYVIGDNRQISFTGNGTFAGAMIAETGTGTSNPAARVSGSANVQACTGTSQHDPKLCYDAAVLARLSNALVDWVSVPSKTVVERVTYSWKEVESE